MSHELPGDVEMTAARVELAGVWNVAYERAMRKGYDQCYAHHCGDLAVERYVKKVEREAKRKLPVQPRGET